MIDTLYLDYAATTPVREEVREAMAPFLAGVYGNASSLHGPGQAARAALDEARATVANAIGARPSEIRFVRGGTESDNLAVIGGYRAQRRRGRGPEAVVSAIEHSAVLESAAYLRERDGARVVIVPVAPDGTMDIDEVVGAVGPDGALVSVMWVNNETGLILPVAELARRLNGTGVLVHSDASQAIGKVAVDVREVPVDLLTGTAHKLSGPKGAGFLFIRDGVEVEPLVYGGSQERGIRPGTEDVAGAVGLATAIRLAVRERDEVTQRMTGLRERLESKLQTAVPGLRVNGRDGDRAPHVSSLGIPDVEDGAALVMALDLEGIAVSGGSACHSGSDQGSHVMAALFGADDDLAPLRVSLGRESTEGEVDRAAETIAQVVARLRRVTAGTGR